MLTVVLTIYFMSFLTIDSQILLYNTENDLVTNKFDCLYVTQNIGEEILYCQRPERNFTLTRQETHCQNEGVKKWFVDLLNDRIEPNEVLKWSSSVEMADLYASIYYNRSFIKENDERFICQCTQLGTFGKFCEYQLTHYKNKFSEAIKAQFHGKGIGDGWDSQRYGDILCYEILPCDSSPLCLDWREICDGVQKCSNGIDEENCDKLEFNECEDDEYRCMNGMCIAEEFWFDGDRDCMDWTDEYVNYGEHCPLTSNTIECDEHLCPVGGYSCGDGECISWLTRIAFQRLVKPEKNCFSKRSLNYMCEADLDQPTWTRENGLCWPDGDYDDPRYPSWNINNLTNEKKCDYLLRCLLSNNSEHDCPCNDFNCKKIMSNICPEAIAYPLQGLINANMIFFYSNHEYEKNTNLNFFHFVGVLKCRGFLSEVKGYQSIEFNSGMIVNYVINQLLCLNPAPEYIYQNFSSQYQIHKFCWNDSFTFNGRPYAVNPDFCASTGQCISQYRIYDGAADCLLSDDEKESPAKSYCTGNVGRQRFQCYNDEHRCIRSEYLGARIPLCSNDYDESWYGNGLLLQQDIPCQKDQTDHCYQIKEYIQQSSNKNHTISDHLQTQNRKNRIPFRSYCDTLWDSETHWDESPSSCQYWLCQSNEYQCQTGQCIRLQWVCDGEWDCTDASDEEAIVLIQTWSPHNTRLLNSFNQLEKCRTRYSKSPFSTICNTSFEFGCYQSGVENPLNITSFRPCINLTQIGDGNEDCHNAYDEKNTFVAKSNIQEMWGFHYRCGNVHQNYLTACRPTVNINCTNIFCSLYRDKEDQNCSNSNDFICLENNQCKKNGRCNGIIECSYGEDEYWCPNGTFMNQGRYRYDKLDIFKQQHLNISLIEYPKGISVEEQVSKPFVDLENDEIFRKSSFECNRGISVIEMNETRCLCPPSFYGRRCEYFSDRLSAIVHLDRQTMPISMLNATLKIQTNFLFNDTIIDQHEFDLLPIIETNKIIKHKFYLLYSRSDSMIEHKRNRYFNQTDVINHHPYSVHFILFALRKNNRPEEVGKWYYPIYFDYLPSSRLAIVLKFPDWFGNSSFNHCEANSCNYRYSTCLPIFNENNSYCSCKSGYYGIDCRTYEIQCDNDCATDAFCQTKTVNGQNKPHCICPLGHFGAGCHLNFQQCNANACQNNGTCYPSYDQSGEEPFLCQCSNKFYGNRCENEKASVHVQLNMTSKYAPRATVVQLYSILLPSLTLQIQYQKVHQGFPSVITFYNGDTRAPPLGIIKMYEDLENPQYLVMYVLNESLINLQSSPQHCPHVSTFLSENIDRSIPIVFHFHQVCSNDTRRVCFHYENYFCLCKSDDFRGECFIHDPELDHCSKCISGGKCLQNDPQDRNDFVCLCPSCHQGHRCEFNSEAFGSTFDLLLLRCVRGLKIFYFCMVILLFIMGLMTNFCSLMTFKRPTPRKFCTGTYLLLVTCFNQLALLFLFLKFIQITFGISSVVSCRIISFLLSVFTRSTYWLTSWVSVDRILLIIYPNSIRLKNARLAILVSTATLIIVGGMHIHETIFYTTIEDRWTNVSICVTDLGTGFVSTYNRVSTPIHHIIPFFIQTVSITLLIIFATRSRARATGQNSSFYQLLRTQFENQKELYITPTLVIFSTLPQVIVSFSLACKDLNEGQRHTLLCAYLLSYTPQVLGFIMYVLPSTSYKKEFGETKIAKKFFPWMFKNVSKAKPAKL